MSGLSDGLGTQQHDHELSTCLQSTFALSETVAHLVAKGSRHRSQPASVEFRCGQKWWSGSCLGGKNSVERRLTVRHARSTNAPGYKPIGRLVSAASPGPIPGSLPDLLIHIFIYRRTQPNIYFKHFIGESHIRAILKLRRIYQESIFFRAELLSVN
jgi:hypothetical protein